MVFGLRSDFKGNLFPGSKKLLAIADELIEIKSICKCGNPATMNIRIKLEEDESKEKQILIGGNDIYKAVCYKHFLKNNKKITYKKKLTLMPKQTINIPKT